MPATSARVALRYSAKSGRPRWRSGERLSGLFGLQAGVQAGQLVELAEQRVGADGDHGRHEVLRSVQVDTLEGETPVGTRAALCIGDFLVRRAAGFQFLEDDF